MTEEGKKSSNEILTIQEYLDKRKARQGIDQNGSECYHTKIRRILNTKEIEIWHY